MNLELHILQNFAPSNLNRDDTNSPKDCEFGGYRRARISSQCLKRAIRTTFKDEHLLPAEQLASRTKRLLDELGERLEQQGHTKEEARAVASVALAGIKLGPKDDGKTQYLLFLGQAEIEGLAAVIGQHWDELAAVASATAEGAEGAKGRSARDVKKAGKQAVSQPVSKALQDVLNGGRAADLALFGRMLADLPGPQRGRGVPGGARALHQQGEYGVRLLHRGGRSEAGRHGGGGHAGDGGVQLRLLLPLCQRGRGGVDPQPGRRRRPGARDDSGLHPGVDPGDPHREAEQHGGAEPALAGAGGGAGARAVVAGKRLRAADGAESRR